MNTNISIDKFLEVSEYVDFAYFNGIQNILDMNTYLEYKELLARVRSSTT